MNQFPILPFPLNQLTSAFEAGDIDGDWERGEFDSTSSDIIDHSNRSATLQPRISLREQPKDEAN